MSLSEIDDLASTGYKAVAPPGCAWPVPDRSCPLPPPWPQECPPAVQQIIDAGVEDLDSDDWGQLGEDRMSLAIVGLWVICDEHFEAADTDN